MSDIPTTRGPGWFERAAQLAIIFGCGAVMVMGWDLLTYYRLSLQVSEAIITGNAEAAPGLHKALQPWTDRIGVMGDARRSQISLTALAQQGTAAAPTPPPSGQPLPSNGAAIGNASVTPPTVATPNQKAADAGPPKPGPVSQVEAELVRFLAVSPADAQAWVALAQQRWDRNAREEALRAWRLARLVAPREGYVLEERAAFGLDHWDDLEPADRGSVVRDSVLALTPGLSIVRMKEVLATKPAESRAQIERDLREEGGMSQADLALLGLGPVKAAP